MFHSAAEDEKDGDNSNTNNLPESLRLRAIVFVNIRATAGIQVHYLSLISNTFH